MLRIFISYHHRKAARQAARVKAFLEKRFPLATVFLDTDNLRLGDEWLPGLAKALFASNVYICLIDDEWAFRVWHPSSIVRRELEVATFNPHRKSLMPLVLGPKTKSNDPSKYELPESIKEILRTQYVQFSADQRGFQELEDRLKSFWAHVAEENHRPVLFISSAIAVGDNESLEYFSLVASELAHALQHGNQRKNLPVDFVLKAPTPSDPVGSQLAMIRELFATADKYLAVIIAPYETAGLAATLAELRRLHPRLPIFTFDKSFSSNEKHFRSCRTLLPPGVMNDWEHGGGLAAQSLIDHFSVMQIRNPRVVVVEGLEGSKERLKGFSDALRRDFHAKVRITCLKDGGFRRTEAREVTAAFLRKKSPGSIHAFFCTNDEMALGCWDAVRAWETSHGRLRSGVRIVGYDGIRDLTGLIQEHDPLLLNTIDVNIRPQIKELAGLLFDTLLTPTGVTPRERVKRVKGRLFLDIEKQRERSNSDVKLLEHKAPQVLKELRS